MNLSAAAIAQCRAYAERDAFTLCRAAWTPQALQEQIIHLANRHYPYCSYCDPDEQDELDALNDLFQELVFSLIQ